MISEFDKNWYKNSDDLVSDRPALIKSNLMYMFAKSNRIFEYKKAPETFSVQDFEQNLQLYGFCTCVDVDTSATYAQTGKESKAKSGVYALYSTLGGMSNANLRPTVSIVSNAYLHFSKSLLVDDECVVVLNDNLYTGLYPLSRKYAELIADAEITLRFALINQRIEGIVTTEKDTGKASADKFFDDIIQGKTIGAVVNKEFMNGLQVSPFHSTNSDSIKSIIESIQYLKSHWYMELGIDANYNMKREAINESETEMNDDTLIPLISQMFFQRKVGIDKLNKMYNLNMSVELSPLWKRIQDDVLNPDRQSEFNEVKNSLADLGKTDGKESTENATK